MKEKILSERALKPIDSLGFVMFHTLAPHVLVLGLVLSARNDCATYFGEGVA